MPEKTLQETFGSSTTQNTTTITLNKTDLGLTSATCTADQVVAAIVIKAKSVLTQSVFDAEPNQNIYLSDGFSSFTTRNNTAYRVDQITINLAKIDSGSTLTPDDY